MPRTLPLLCLAALSATPAQAATGRASVAVSLQVEPSCTARLPATAQRPQAPTIGCAEVSMKRSIERRTPTPYTVNTYRNGDRTVISIDF